ncbi:hypothetical protein PGB90_005191 [Kerria lacca]
MLVFVKLFTFLIILNTISDTFANIIFANVRGKRRAVIYPGTKWCGNGNIAENYDDLGEDRDTDMCCREHDSCPEYIEAGKTKYGLTNTASYTRLHCSCDDKFHRCLRKNVEEKNSTSSSMVGYIYFNRLKTKCYKLERPIVGCKTDTKKRQCEDYNIDENSPPIWQWFDVPSFK